jgi:uncharacterized protein
VLPIKPGQRIAPLDILRGFALFGILLVNSLGFNASFFDFGGFYNHLPDAFQQKFYTIFISLTADKFIFLFSFLFGYGIFMQYNRFIENDLNFSGFFTRRMLVLALFGIAHIVFLWAGDILFLYAIAGFFVFFLRKSTTAVLFLLASFFYLFIGIWLLIGLWLPLPDALSSTCASCLEEARIIYSQGNYIGCLQLRLQEYFAFRNINAFYYLPKIIGISLFGFIASKIRLHEKIVSNPQKWWLVFVFTALTGAALYFGYEKVVDFESPYANAVYMAGYELMNVFVASAYLLFILLISTNKTIAKLLKPLALMGRASLTNYLMQSLILGFIFYGWGLGFFGQTKVTNVVLIAICIYLFQLLLNVVWFRFFSRGPLESLWRRLSYGIKTKPC